MNDFPVALLHQLACAFPAGTEEEPNAGMLPSPEFSFLRNLTGKNGSQ
jgi:hypothetical protein